MEVWFKRNAVVVEEYVDLQERLLPYVTVDVVAAEAAVDEPEVDEPEVDEPEVDDLIVVTLA